MPCGDADRLVEVLDVDQVEAAEMFARFLERTVGHKPFAVAHPNAGCRRDRVQRSSDHILPIRLEVVREPPPGDEQERPPEAVEASRLAGRSTSLVGIT